MSEENANMPSKKNIYAALAKAQAQFKTAVFDSTNPYFSSKYASLSAVISAVRDALAKNELCVVQFPAITDTHVILTTEIGHSSGESISSVLHMPLSQKTAQAVGSAITYARRYALSSILCIAADGDDDANAATSQTYDVQEGQIPKKESTSSKKAVSAYLQNAISDLKNAGINAIELDTEAKKLGLSGAREIEEKNISAVVSSIKEKFGKKQ